MYAPEARDRGGLQPVYTPSAEAVYEAVEILAGDEWLAKRWIASGGGNAGDLGVLAMHELALTYAPTHRRFRAALEEWELELHETVDDERG